MNGRTLLAYLAGAIDADGTIGIKKSTYSMRVTKDSGQPAYSERVALRQVTPDVPKLLRDTFGGSLYTTGPSSRNGKTLHSWAVTDKRAAVCIRRLLPFLIVKERQARNALLLRSVKEKSKKARVAKGRGHVGAGVRPPELSERMERLYLAAKSLNRVGR